MTETTDSLIQTIEKSLREGSHMFAAQPESWAKCAKHIAEAIANSHVAPSLTLEVDNNGNVTLNGIFIRTLDTTEDLKLIALADKGGAGCPGSILMEADNVD